MNNISTPIIIDTLPLVLTVTEASKVLRLGKNAVYGLVRCGALRSIKVGKSIRIPKTALSEFLSGTGKEVITHG